ncbi:MAG: DUF1579 domain-containing protein [Desulfobacteraceae bacterium]|nr:MAG: DUF1579 domain-containing protein [Desulfobacteraceae bacterium]
MAQVKGKQERRTDMQEMMEVYKNLATPGEPHKLLARMAGTWSAKVKAWMEPDKPPMESSGTSEDKMVLGDRFLQQDFTGDMMGAPFSGIGFSGYDNHTRKYISTWMDSMGTAIMYFEGSAEEDGKTITQHSSYDDPIKGPMKWRTVTRFVDDDTHVFEMYSRDMSGKEEKMLEITYTRKK